MAGASTDDEVAIIGASDEDEVAIGAASDEDDTAITGASDDDAGAASDELTGAAEDDDGAGASDDEAGGATDELAALDGAVFTGVVAGLLKIQIRPMITITATMMIIQVLRFIGGNPWVGRIDWEG